MVREREIGIVSGSTKKLCAHCEEPIGFHAFMDFIKDGYSDSVHCGTCYEINYLERDKKNIVDSFTGLFAVLVSIMTFLGINVLLGVMTYNSQDGSYRIFALGIAGGLFAGFLAGGLFLSLRKWRKSRLVATEDLTLELR